MFKMGTPLGAALLLGLFAATTALRLDSYPDLTSRHFAHAQMARAPKPRARLLQEEDPDQVCAEGCFEPPTPLADPYPLLIASSTDGNPITLQECYDLAKSSTTYNISYIAIIDDYSCYGGESMPDGWAEYDGECPLGCVPNATAPGPCGGASLAAIFSFGKCVYPGTPCNPESVPSSPSVNPSSPSAIPTQSPEPSTTASPSPSTSASPPAAPSQPPPPDAPSQPPPPDVTAPPPPNGKTYQCRSDKTVIYGRPLDSLPRTRLNPKHTSEENSAECQALCDANDQCTGFYYKTTTLCYLFSEVFAYTVKTYSTAVVACRVQ